MVIPFLCLAAAQLAVEVRADLGEQGPQTKIFLAADYGEVRYVSKKTGSDRSGSGSSSNPWRSLPHALSQITDADADYRYAILVARGKYFETPVVMKEFVDLFGGFEPESWTRDIFSYPSVLDGDKKGRVAIAANYSGLDGFVIKDGLVRGNGAGLLCRGTSPRITNNRFVYNRTLQPRPWCPRQLHEIANDGGAIYCADGAKPVIANNVFSKNQTSIGRGAAIAMHGHCSGEIINSVFLDNTTGMNDSMRSSDGGAVSIFDRSHPRIADNIFIRNRALSSNDGGALFVALWSAPKIEKNMFVDNSAGDDASGVFVGGQEHRYGKPKDPLPDGEDYFFTISKNVFVGNAHHGWNPSTLKVTMESRGLIVNNILAHNARFSVENSEAAIINNTVLGKVTLGDETDERRATHIANNIFWGPLVSVSPTKVQYCNLRDSFQGIGNISEEPAFVNDHRSMVALSSFYESARFETGFYVTAKQLNNESLANRVVRAGDHWSVVKSSEANHLTVWGNVSGEPSLLVLPSYRLQPESPCINRGSMEKAPDTDINGDNRPVGNGVDIGADEFMQ